MNAYFWIMCQGDWSFDLKINLGHSDLSFRSNNFAIYLEDYLMNEHHALG